MPCRGPQSDLSSFCKASYDGDLPLLKLMLDFSDPVLGFQGDINTHQSDFNALHYAAVNGQLECVQALLAAGADPHMKTRMPKGSAPSDGKTAGALADEWGWADVSAALKAAEQKVPKGDYVLGGPLNNAKIYPSSVSESGQPKDAAAATAKKLSSMYRPYFMDVSETPTTVGLLFPGQGSQYVKMLDSVKDMPAVKAMMESGKKILGWDPLDLCLKGPASKLESADFSHPVLFIAGLAALEKLKETNPEAASKPGAVAGLGVGSITALVAADVMTFEDGLKVVKARAEAMTKASSGQAILSVAGLRQKKLEALCAKVGGECYISNMLFPKGATCAGSKDKMTKLEAEVKSAGALQAKLITTTGAFNTPMMEKAVPALEAVLSEVSSKMKPPKCDIYETSAGSVIYAGSAPSLLMPVLLRSMTMPILWETCVKNMIQAGMSEFYEVGPMKQLKAMMKRIDPAAHEATTCLEV